MSDLKVNDRRWWVRGDAPAAEEPKLKPAYVEELEGKLAAKDAELQQFIAKYRGASDEFDQARARLRKELSKDVERGRRSLIAGFLDVLDNLDRALDAAAGREDDPFVQGVSLVRQQFLSTLEGLGVRRTSPLGQPFDPAHQEAVATVAATADSPAGTVIGIVRPGYLIGDEVLRPAQVAVTQ
jgi:molecular chaperone GrpE